MDDRGDCEEFVGEEKWAVLNSKTRISIILLFQILYARSNKGEGQRGKLFRKCKAAAKYTETFIRKKRR